MASGDGKANRKQSFYMHTICSKECSLKSCFWWPDFPISLRLPTQGLGKSLLVRFSGLFEAPGDSSQSCETGPRPVHCWGCTDGCLS